MSWQSFAQVSTNSMDCALEAESTVVVRPGTRIDISTRRYPVAKE